MNETSRAVAIEKAMLLFWKNGYAATTMRDIQRCLDMRPGSVYSAFGGKDELYEKSLRLYSDMVLTNICGNFEVASSAIEGLIQSVNFIIFPNNYRPSHICFLVKSVTELESASPYLTGIALNGLEFVRVELERQIEQVIKEDKNAQKQDKTELSILVQSQIIGLKTMLSLGCSEAQIGGMVSGMIRKIVLS
ncbi:TetR/AcrR family transcriptional regulator [Alteromonas sp. a30]|uniref:TetR/AcrR family transcriptional regulator n=1 Tax=Alteromonas sp. a30 TaxID=2730917 RepID=UPI002280170D|nr:TetR/AcrR family transcriptional regulator [Alteromonas sp. a30]MCY7297276.1 helix-turn-helix transcriptional regulator [Alteromonas sp. a30]